MLKLIKGQEFKDDVKQFREEYQRRLLFNKTKYNFFYGPYSEKRQHKHHSRLAKSDSITGVTDTKSHGEASASPSRKQKKAAAPIGYIEKQKQFYQAQNKKKQLIQQINGSYSPVKAMTEQIEENNKKGDLQHLYTDDEIVEMFMKFPAIKTQEEILREMQRRLANPES